MFKSIKNKVSGFGKAYGENLKVVGQYGAGFRKGLGTRTMTGQEWRTRQTNPYSAGKQAGINANMIPAKAKIRIQGMIENAAKRKLSGGY